MPFSSPLMSGVLTVGISVVCGAAIGKAVLTGVAVVGILTMVNVVVMKTAK